MPSKDDSKHKSIYPADEKRGDTAPAAEKEQALDAGELIKIILKKEFVTPGIDIQDRQNWRKTWNGEILVFGNIYKVNNEFCVYAGDFKSIAEVPRSFCCYTIGDEMRVRHVRLDPDGELPPKERKRRVDDDRPIDTAINNIDNTLMILIKTAIKHKRITRGDFKRFYPNISDMNNILRCIEKGENLSWARFNDLIEKLNITYRLMVFDEDKTLIGSNEQ
jgi:hypothetical protein